MLAPNLAKVRHAALSSQGTGVFPGDHLYPRTVQTKGTDSFSGRRPARLSRTDLLSVQHCLRERASVTRTQSKRAVLTGRAPKAAWSLEAAASVRDKSHHILACPVPGEKHAPQCQVTERASTVALDASGLEPQLPQLWNLRHVSSPPRALVSSSVKWG